MKRVTVVASEEQIELWKEAAHVRRVTMSEWIRRMLDANAKSVIERGADERRS